MAKNNSKNSPTSPPNRSVDDVMEQTEVGSFIIRYKVELISLVAAVLISLIGLGIYSNYKEGENARLAQVVHAFKSNEFQSFKGEKMDASQFIAKLNELVDKIGDYEGLISVLIGAADVMVKNDNLEGAKTLLEKGKDQFSRNNPWVKYFILSRLAVVYEDLGQTKEAISTLEELAMSGVKIMEGKVYLDLGRLYLETGDTKRAKQNLSYVIDKFSENNFDKMAKLYLKELEARK